MAELTFIIPTTNRPTLKNAINSLAAQTNSNWYAVIVGDGIAPPVQTDRRMHTTFVAKKDSPGLVRNEAIGIIETPYVAFLDDDDELTPGYVETFYQHVGADLIIQKMSNLHPDGKRSVIPFHLEPEKLEYGQVGVNFAVKKNIFERHPFVDHRHHGNEDWEFVKWCRDNQCSITITDNLGYVVRP